MKKKKGEKECKQLQRRNRPTSHVLSSHLEQTTVQENDLNAYELRNLRYSDFEAEFANESFAQRRQCLLQ